MVNKDHLKIVTPMFKQLIFNTEEDKVKKLFIDNDDKLKFMFLITSQNTTSTFYRKCLYYKANRNKICNFEFMIISILLTVLHKQHDIVA